jgi:DNA polymerase III delta prime subunit
MPNHLDYEPKSWSEFYEYKKDLNIQKAIIWRKKQVLPTFVYIEGASGSGKTVYAKALIRSFLCENYNLETGLVCGECKTCRADPANLNENSNVIWLSSSFNSNGNTTQQSAIKDALQKAEQGPLVTYKDSKRPEVLFLVFEEAQNIHKDLLQRVLAFGDIKNHITSRLCFIFITMSPEEMNPTVNKALRQRGSTCSFKQPSLVQLEDFLLKQFPDVNKEVAKILAEESEGSYRGAINLYQDAKSVVTDLNPSVVSKLFQTLTFEERKPLWLALQGKETLDSLRYRIENLMYLSSPTKLIKQMQTDLDNQFIESKCEVSTYLEVTRLFTEYLINPSLINVVSVLLQVRSKYMGFSR